MNFYCDSGVNPANGYGSGMRMAGYFWMIDVVVSDFGGWM
jgi:hypothetical protein